MRLFLLAWLVSASLLCLGAPAGAVPADTAADPLLDHPEVLRLLDMAERGNQDLAAAQGRILQADAAARIAGATLLPAVGANAAAARQDRLGGGASVEGRSWSAGLSASYELDFWGRKQATVDAARLGLAATVLDRDTVRLTLAAGVMSSWVQAVALQERERLAGQSLEATRRVLALIEARARSGAALPLELAQQRTLVATQQQAWLALRQQREQAGLALGLLLGQVTAHVPATLALPGAGSAADFVPMAQLPLDLLVRRPDVAAAEARLQAADANIAAARAAMLPALTLEGGLGWSSDSLGRLLANPLYALAGNIVATVFDGGRLAAGRDLAQAQRESLLASYRQAWLTALGDVHDARVAAQALDARLAAQSEVELQAGRARGQAELRYRAGAQTLLELLDAQRTLFAARDLAVQLQAERLQARVALYRALGGRWSEASW